MRPLYMLIVLADTVHFANVLHLPAFQSFSLICDVCICRFLDKFDPMWTPNLTDYQGRRYGSVALLCRAVCRRRWKHVQLSFAGAGRNHFVPRMGQKLQPALCCRYCYKNQIQIGQWNLAQLASALVAADLCSQVCLFGQADLAWTLQAGTGLGYLWLRATRQLRSSIAWC
jgi:hypothetical protein